MNEFDELDKEAIDMSEIDRIQQEIDKEISSAASEIAATEMAATEMPPTATELSTEDGMPEPAFDPIEKTVFYTETIKNERSKNKKDRFKRTVALVCIISILGGSFLGLGIGIGIPISQRLLLPRITGENTEDAADQEELITADEPADPETSYVFKAEPPAIPLAESDAEYHLGTNILVDIVNTVEPSVVAITTVMQGSSSFYYDITNPRSGSGSGIIFNEDKEKIYIVTNYHVIGGATNVSVSIEGSDALSAKLVGSEPQSDLAVISITKALLQEAGIQNVKIASFGDSDQMQVGETVLAIGNALGEGNTATVGIISAKNKQINVEDKVLDVIQTDAAINPGNSGGPLVNTKGEVIGINTAKLSQSSVEGMGYSITANIAKPIIAELMNQITKPFLGISGYDVDEATAEMYNLPQLGVFVNTVVKGSSAEAGGIVRGDIITGFDDKSIFTMEQLSETIKSCQIGQEVQIKILRDGKTPIVLTVKLTAFNNDNF